MPAVECAIVAFSRRPANMSFAHGQISSSLYNRKTFLAQQGIDYQDLVCARQVHGDTIVSIDERDKGKGACSHETAIADADALITASAGVPIAVFTADCLSILLYNPEIPCVAAVHAGWRSTKSDIVAKTVARLHEEFHVRPETLRAFLGPCIRPCCYEVGPEFKNFFPEDVGMREGKYYFDIAQVNMRQLLESGVLLEHISDEGFCTNCHPDKFFSFRREGAGTGRMMSVIMVR